MNVLAQVDLSDSLQRMWNNVVEVLPKMVLFLVILIVGMLIAKAVERIVDSVLEKIGFDRWVERGGVKRALDSTPYDASSLLAKIAYYALVLLTLQLAFGVFGPNPISSLLEGLVAYLPNIFVAILIVVIGAYIATAVRDIVQSALSSQSYGRMVATIAYVAIVVIAVFAALDQLEVAPSIVNGLFYAILAVIAGSLIIAVGGGGITPMRSRWERFLNRVDEETSISDTTTTTPPRV